MVFHFVLQTCDIKNKHREHGKLKWLTNNKGLGYGCVMMCFFGMFPNARLVQTGVIGGSSLCATACACACAFGRRTNFTFNTNYITKTQWIPLEALARKQYPYTVPAVVYCQCSDPIQYRLHETVRWLRHAWFKPLVYIPFSLTRFNLFVLFIFVHSHALTKAIVSFEVGQWEVPLRLSQIRPLKIDAWGIRERDLLMDHFLADGVDQRAFVLEFLPACVPISEGSTFAAGHSWRLEYTETPALS